MAARKLKPIEERDPYAALVLDAYDRISRLPQFAQRDAQELAVSSVALTVEPSIDEVTGSSPV